MPRLFIPVCVCAGAREIKEVKKCRIIAPGDFLEVSNIMETKEQGKGGKRSNTTWQGNGTARETGRGIIPLSQERGRFPSQRGMAFKGRSPFVPMGS